MTPRSLPRPAQSFFENAPRALLFGSTRRPSFRNPSSTKRKGQLGAEISDETREFARRSARWREPLMRGELVLRATVSRSFFGCPQTIALTKRNPLPVIIWPFGNILA